MVNSGAHYSQHQLSDEMLNFPGPWRFRSPPGHEPIPPGAVSDIFDMIQRIAEQDQQYQHTLERFKASFAPGTVHICSSSESWAETDLLSYMDAATANAPLFIEAFYDGCEASRDQGMAVPGTDVINDVLASHGVRFRIEPPDLIPTGRDNAAVVIPVPERPPTLAQEAVVVLQHSLARSDELLEQGRAREAVQEILFILESVTTAFRGLDTEAGRIGGGYFNQIVRELRQRDARPALDKILNWLGTMHGYLSSPAGGGVRHGLDLNRGIEISDSEARLYCNLTRSYLSFLLAEHERLVARSQG